jgi:hypothetical protein
MPIWIPLIIQVIPFANKLIDLIIAALRKRPTERREAIANKLENLVLKHQIDHDEKALVEGVKEIQDEIKSAD